MTYIDLWDDGTYTDWTGVGAGGPSLASYVWECDPDGDASYIVATAAGQKVTFQPFTWNPTTWPRAHRFDAIRIVAWVKTTGANATFRFKLRMLDQEFNSENFTITSPAYIEQAWELPLTPDGQAWSVTRLWYDYSGFELGLEFISGDELRCTKFHIFSSEVPYPHWTVVPSAPGSAAQWAAFPATAAPFSTLQKYDGDESYCYSTVGGEISVFPHDAMGAPFPTEVERVRVVAMVKNLSSTPQTFTPILRLGGVDYRGGCDTLGTVIPPDGVWHLAWTEFISDPSLMWPAGHPAGGAWTQAQINAVEIGFENTSGGDFRVTSLAMEVFLVPTGVTTIDWFPTADGFHVDFPPTVPGAGEAAWEDVDEDPPDDAASYIEASTAASGTPQYCSFVCGGAGAPGANERVYLVELTARVRLGNLPHSTAKILPVLRDSSTSCSFFGTPVTIESTGALWFDVRWQYYNNPWEGRWVWGSAGPDDPAVYEFGLGVLDGDLLISRIRARVITCYDYPSLGAPDTIDMQVTTGAVNMINRSVLDGTLYAVTEFAVGLGGYVPAAPQTITPIVPGDLALFNEIWRGSISRVVYTSDPPPWNVQYWCRLPRAEAIQGIGEVGLFAEILWSPFPWEIGTKFLFAIQHHPLQVRHEDMVNLYVLQVTYP